MKQPVGHFHAKGENREDFLVIVSQELRVDKNGVIVNSKKHFSLNSVEGEEVIATDSPDRFITRKGIKLKKVSLIKDSVDDIDRYIK